MNDEYRFVDSVTTYRCMHFHHHDAQLVELLHHSRPWTPRIDRLLDETNFSKQNKNLLSYHSKILKILSHRTCFADLFPFTFQM